MVIASQHRHCGLHQDRTGIHHLLHQMGGAAAEGHPGGQGLAHRIEPPEAGQQGGVDVHQPARIGSDQHGGDNAHPARHHHQVHVRGGEAGRHLPVEVLPQRMVAVVMEMAGDAEAFRPLAGTTDGVVHHQLHHLGVEGTAAAGPDQGLKVAAMTGGHHPEPQGTIQPGPGLRCFARRVWRWPLDGLHGLASVMARGHGAHVPSLHPANSSSGCRSAGGLPPFDGAQPPAPCSVAGFRR